MLASSLSFLEMKSLLFANGRNDYPCRVIARDTRIGSVLVGVMNDLPKLVALFGQSNMAIGKCIDHALKNFAPAVVIANLLLLVPDHPELLVIWIF